jgi:hypothetical protein
MKNRNSFKIIIEKTRNLTFKQLILIFGIIFILIIAIPSISFIVCFKDQQISNNVEDWGAFGSYIGGVLGVIIALANLVVLIVITIQVNKLNSEENKNLFLFQKRIEAYNELSKFTSQLNTLPSELNMTIQYFGEKITERQLLIDNQLLDDYSQNIESIIKLKYECDKKLNDLRRIFNGFYFFMITFNLRFGHFFAYDFNSNEFKTAMELLSKLNETFNKFASFEKSKNIDFVAFHSEYLMINNLILPVINKLRKELE